VSKKNKATSRLAARYLDDKILLSSTHAWTYMRLPLVPYEFMSYGSREGLCDQITTSLATLITNNQETIEVHLRVTYRPLNTFQWATKLNKRASLSTPTPGWSNYLGDMAEHVDNNLFDEKEVYLGVCLGERRKAKENKSSGLGSSALGEALAPLKDITRALESFAKYDDLVVSDKELEYWHDKADDVHRSLSRTALRAVPATSDEVAWLIARPLWPEMSQPSPSASSTEVWGAGEIVSLAEGIVTNHRRCVEVEQVDTKGNPQKGFAITLAISRFPDALYFPEQEPWIHFAAALPFSVDFSTRFSIVPALKVQKDVGKKLAVAKDQAIHIAESGTSVPLKIQEQLQVASMLEYTIDKDRMPWAYARHRITVFGETNEEVVSRARSVIESYRELSIDVSWPSGDQFDLLCESMPGDIVRSKSYYQRQELAVVGGGMPTASSQAGDRIEGKSGWMGPYLGRTTSRVVTPVFFAPHVAMARNNPPGVAIIGQPGGGKALALDTPIATPQGWTTMGDIKVDDFVLGKDGNPTKVIATTEVMIGRPCYQIEFSDGSIIKADEKHLWTVWNVDLDWVTLETLEILNAISSGKQFNVPATHLNNQRKIISIIKIESVPVRCIQVDALDHLFLVGKTMIPTHNSFLAFTLAYQMALQGVWTIYIDPKADAKPMGNLGGLGEPKVFDLREGNDGMLDPFSMGENIDDSRLLALETLKLLLGSNFSEEREEALNNAVKTVASQANPSLTKVVDNLLASELTAARNLGTILDNMRTLPFARLCFAPTTGVRLRPEDGLTIITLLGLSLPAAGTKTDDLTYENRLAVSVMYLLTRYARQLMLNMDKSHPKAICIDEAWAITSTPQGAKLIPEVARMGRSHNTALILVSQNAGDLMEESVTNSLSTKFAFRSTIPGEIDDVMNLFGLELDQGYQSAVRDLRNGECLMQDVDGRVARVQVDAWNRELFNTFNTNPETRGKGQSASQKGNK